MNKEEIKTELYNNFIKWKNINFPTEETTKEELKRYLGYFGVNRRNNQGVNI